MTSAANMAGKAVEALGDRAYVEGGTPKADFYISIDVPASRVNVNIENEAGKVVRTVTMTDLPAGSHKVEWDGKDSDGNSVPDGIYKISVEARDSYGNPFEPQTFIKGLATGIAIESGGINVDIGGVEVTLDKVMKITI
jgi:flagellar basal-body rod modification protein FlgD